MRLFDFIGIFPSLCSFLSFVLLVFVSLGNGLGDDKFRNVDLVLYQFSYLPFYIACNSFYIVLAEEQVQSVF